MRKKYLLLVLLLFCVCTGLRGQTFNLQTGREPIASLDGLWRFHTGDNPQWARPDFDDSQWPLVRSDEDWAKQGYPGYSGYAWYRFTIQVPDGNKPLSLLLTSIMTGYRVYADGNLTGGYGYMPPSKLAKLSRPAEYALPRASQSGPRTIYIAIRVWQDPESASYLPGGALGPGNLAGDSMLVHRHLRTLERANSSQMTTLYAYSTLAALFGLVVLGLFFYRPAEREYLWFSLLLLCSGADAALYIVFFLASMPIEMFDLIEGCLLALFQIAGLLFFSTVLSERRAAWWCFSCGAASLASIGMFLYYFHWTSVPGSGIFQVVCLMPSELWILAVLVKNAVRKDADARLLLFPVLLVYGFVLADNLAQITFQLGWQRREFSLNAPVLQHPFDLGLKTVLFTVFVFVMMLFLVRRFSLARKEEERLASEFEAARSMQSLLVPANPPNTPGFAVESVYLPASEVGGDFFQVLPGDDGSLLIVVGDVSGKRLKAAMTVSAIVGALRNETSRQPAQVLAHLNRVLHGQIQGFVTCSAALIAAAGTMTLANAGHLSPYRNGEEMAVESGLPLGILAEASYAETTCQIKPGDRLTFLSDGVVEATNEKKELFGFERTQAISNQPAQAIAEAAKLFGQQDDISVLSVQVLATPPT